MDGDNRRVPAIPPPLSAVVPISTRDGTLSKDGFMRNLMVDTRQDGKKFVRKRPGSSLYTTYNGGGAGTDQGIWYHNGFIYAAADNVLSRIVSPTSSGYADGAAWSSLTVPTWVGRSGAACAELNGQIFVTGGRSSIAGTVAADVWSSLDGGTTWTQLVSAAPWAARANHQLVVLNNRLYLMGGSNFAGTFFNDVWVSDDGVNWTLVNSSAGWAARSSFAALAFNNGLWVLGGSTGAAQNDVWFSTDGNTWTQMIAAAGWAARSSHGGLVFSGKMWILGGTAGTREVWSSPDGITWTMATAVAWSSGRRDFGCVVYNGAMWVVAGFDGAAYLTQAWSSIDGAAWTQATAAFGGAARGGCALVVSKHPTSTIGAPAMFLIGGTDLVPNYYKEVWVSNINGNLTTNWVITGAPNPPLRLQACSVGNNRYFALKDTRGMYVLVNNTITKVSDPNYPAVTVPGVVNLDETVYVMDPTGLIRGSNINDPNTWPSRNFLGADYESDGGVRLIKYQNFVVAGGEYTTQFFYNSGSPSSVVLRPVKNMNARVGWVFPYAALSLENTIVWLGRTEKQGKIKVYGMQGNAIIPLSDSWVESIINRWASTDAIYALNVKGRGHSFYVLTNATQNLSIAFDWEEKVWGQWDYGNPTSVFYRYGHTASDGTNSYGLEIGFKKISTIEEAVLTEQGTTFRTQVTTNNVDDGDGELAKFCASLGISADRIASATVQIEVSKDDYQTWINYGTFSLNQPRTRVPRIGKYYRMAVRVTCSTDTDFRMSEITRQIRMGN